MGDSGGLSGNLGGGSGVDGSVEDWVTWCKEDTRDSVGKLICLKSGMGGATLGDEGRELGLEVYDGELCRVGEEERGGTG